MFSDQRDPNRVEERQLGPRGWGQKELGSWGAALVWRLLL